MSEGMASVKFVGIMNQKMLTGVLGIYFVTMRSFV